MRRRIPIKSIMVGALLLAGQAGTARAQDLRIFVKPDTAVTNKAFDLRWKAEQLTSGAKPDWTGALALLRDAEKLYTSVHDTSGLMVTASSIGQAYRVVGPRDSAFVVDRRVLQWARADDDRRVQMVVLTELALLFSQEANVDSAVTNYQRAAEIAEKAFDAVDLARICRAISQVYENAGRPDSALWYAQGAMGNFEIVGDTLEMGNSLNAIGLIFHELAQSDSSLTNYRNAIVLFRKLQARREEGWSLGNIGVVYADIGQPDSALTYYRQALVIARDIGDRRGEAATLHNLGGAYAMLDRADSAASFLTQALAIRLGTGDSLGVAKTYINIAASLEVAEQLDSARTLLMRAIDLSEGAHSPLVEGAAWTALGRVSRKLKRPDKAMVALTSANYLQMQTGDRAHQAQTLAEFGILYRAQGLLEQATVSFERSAVLTASMSSAAGGEFNQLQYNEKSADLFGSWTQTWLDRARPGPGALDSTVATFASLAANERGRAQALLRLMGTAREIKAGGDLAAEGRALAHRSLATAAGALIYAIANDTLITWLALRDGTIHVSQQSVPQARLDTLVAALRYGVAQEDAAVVRTGHITRGSSPFLDPLDQKVLTVSTIARAKAENGMVLRRELSAVLLPPEIAKNLPASGELLIVPQGGLGLIPFGVLPIPGGKVILGERFALRYGPSLTAIADAEARPAIAAGDRAKQLAPVLVVGDPSMPAPFALDGEKYAFDPLPGARMEGKAVADSLGAVSWLSGPTATEEAVRSAIPSARIIHLATHGLVYSSDAHARLSFVALAPDATHDGHLSVAKIVDSLSFRAELVVLSACQTAVGNVKSAEGTLGLQRAVLGKGARSVLVSLWNVSDEATLFLIQRFYHHWLHDANAPTKSEALRLAQADVRAEAGKTRAHRAWADPFYWAAFQLVGAP